MPPTTVKTYLPDAQHDLAALQIDAGRVYTSVLLDRAQLQRLSDEIGAMLMEMDIRSGKLVVPESA